MKTDYRYNTLLSLAAITALILHPAAADEPNLLHHYPLDGTLNAKSGGSPLTLTPDTEVVYAKEGPAGKRKSVLFGSIPGDETQRLIMPEDVTLPVVGGALSLWVKVPQIDPNKATAFILHAPGFSQDGSGITSGCYISVNGREEAISWQLAGGGKQMDLLADLSEWTHLVLTWNESQSVARLYVNGKESGEATIPQGPELNMTHPIRIGGFATRPELDSQDHQFNGMISDLRIYEGELTRADIKTLYKP